MAPASSTLGGKKRWRPHGSVAKTKRFWAQRPESSSSSEGLRFVPAGTSSRGAMHVVAGATDPMDSRGRRRSQRAAARAAIEHDSSTGTYLRIRSITDATKATYNEAFWAFADFSTKGAHTRNTPTAADATLELYFDKLFFDGENPHVGETTIAALGYYMRWSTKGCLRRISPRSYQPF